MAPRSSVCAREYSLRFRSRRGAATPRGEHRAPTGAVRSPVTERRDARTREGSPRWFRRWHGSRRFTHPSRPPRKGTERRARGAHTWTGATAPHARGSAARMDACPRVVIKLCCRNRYRSLSLKEARVTSTFPTREGAGNAWAGASSAWETVRGRKTSGGSCAGRKRG